MTEGQREPYTDHEKAELRALWKRRDLSHEQIAKMLNRTVASVKVKACQMHLGRRPKEWTFAGRVWRQRQAEARGAGE